MKFSFISALLLGAVSTVLADIKYFNHPSESFAYTRSSTITFVSKEVSNDDDTIVKAVLYRSDGTWVKDIRTWTGKHEDYFTFVWYVDVKCGLYFIRIFQFNEDDYRNGKFDDDNDDIIRSHAFYIGNGSRNKRSIYSP